MKYLFFFLFVILSEATFADTLPAAQNVLKEASFKARKENKNILLMFTASWCVWCKKMDRSIEDRACKAFFDENYVVVHLNVQESRPEQEHPGSAEVWKQFKGENSGIPFWVILDPDLNLLADSYIRLKGQSKGEPGENIGCPASEEEVNAFMVILRETSRTRQENLPLIEQRFRKNKE